MNRTRRLHLILPITTGIAAALISGFSASALAQDYPQKPVRLTSA